ncbi:MAG: type III-B CRISPR module RAMP protein Cmr4 [Bacteroidia bacterium]|nr:type III-B CRISPR module RAMP protein Cmr4 [Bacteroidia bacterium]
MFKKSRPLFLLCESPLHAGSGSELGIVDLPIQREKHTDFPKIEASSLKGAVRQAFETKLVLSESDKEKAKQNLITINRIFGYDEAEVLHYKDTQKNAFKEYTQFMGCVAVSDARLLLFPVKSLHGVFAWLTCPKIINRFIEDMQLAGISEGIPSIDAPQVIAVAPETTLVDDKKLQLEEFIFKNPDKNEQVKKLGIWLKNTLLGEQDKSYWAGKLEKDIVVLNDTDFTHFVKLSTEVITRTKIDNTTGTVAEGALFTEEYLPAESVLYSIVLFADEMSKYKEEKMNADKVKEFFIQGLPRVMQVGANATLGKGIVKTKFVDKQEGGTK